MSEATIVKTVTLNNRYGLHARPAALFVEVCNRYQSDVQIGKDGASANGKNILEVMTLGAESGSQLTISCTGADAEQLAVELVALVEGNFGEA